MIPTTEKEISTTAQESFWNKLQQFKFDLFFFGNHYSKCVKVLKWIKYIIVGFTTASTLVWMQWSEISFVPTICSIIILVLQVFSAITDIFPFSNRRDELRELTNDLEPIYIEMESVWRKIAEGELTLSEIDQSIDAFANKRLQIERNYLKNDFLKEGKRIVNKTNAQTRDYFNHF